MKKIIMILLLVSMCILSGCGENEITGDVVKDINIEEWDELLSQCPDCPECAVCQVCPESEEKECPKCVQRDCPKCERCEECEDCIDFGKEPVKIELDTVRVLQKVKETGDEQQITIRYTEDELDNLDYVDLRFEPDCRNSVDTLIIEVNGDEIYDRSPRCNEAESVRIRNNKFNSGRNKIIFRSEDEDNYDLDDVEIESRFEDDTYDIDGYGSIEILEATYESNKLTDLDDVEIRNYIIYEFDLDDEETEEDLQLRFDSKVADGMLYVYVNGKNIFEDEIDRETYKITIPKKYLDSGENEIKFLGIPD